MKNVTDITATAIYKVTIRETGKECYAVPSDSQPGVYYITCWNESECRWTCTCEAGKHGKTCKHVRAAQTSILANKAQSEAYASRLHNGVSYQRYSDAVESQNSPESLSRRERDAEKRQHGILNGNRGFSLLK